ESVEHVWMLREGIRERRPCGDRLAHLGQGLLEVLVRRLGRERREDPGQVKPAGEHGGELAGEQDERYEAHALERSPKSALEAFEDRREPFAAWKDGWTRLPEREHESTLSSESDDQRSLVLSLGTTSTQHSRRIRDLVFEYGHCLPQWPETGAPTPPLC